MRINLGIRRHLATLLGGDRRRIELMNSFLFSLPGTPIVYYGDEIGMGDNPFLGDRDGVRTQMQWSADSNAGFSRVDTVALYLPPVLDPLFGYGAVNVELQRRLRSSLLNWMRCAIRVRNAHQAFGRGDITFLSPPNRKVLAYLRHHDGETILCVASLSETPQVTELDLAPWAGCVPVDLFGSCAFMPIGEQAYPVMLTGHGFYWLRLLPGAEAEARRETPLEAMDRPELPPADRPLRQRTPG
jgi:glycosidase